MDMITGGIIGFLLFLITLLIHNPERAEKIKEIFLLPIFRLFRFGAKQYIASKIAYTTSEFLRTNFYELIPSLQSAKIRIRWVLSPEDPVLHRDGSLILYLRETNDQTRNILIATQAALPRLVCATLRPNIVPLISDAIDLTLLRKLTDGLGKHAVPIFQKYFLTPAIEDRPDLTSLFKELVELDKDGIFVPIFLEELNQLGDTLYANTDTSDKSSEIFDFLKYLLTEARREEHEHIKLDHLSRDFKVGIILLALSLKMEREGVTPYIKRLEEKIKKGCDSIYIIAFEPAFGFLRKLQPIIDGNHSLTLAKTVTVREWKRPHSHSHRKIALYRRTPLLADTTFEDRVNAIKLKVADSVECQVLDVSEETTFLDVKGLSGVAYKSDLSWTTLNRCSDVLQANEKRKFLVKHIDIKKALVHLTLRFPETDPWKSPTLPKVGQTIEVTIFTYNPFALFGRHETGLEATIPRPETSWTEFDEMDPATFVGKRVRILVTERVDDKRILTGSIRELTKNPWPAINKKFRPGTQLRGIVAEVTPLFVRVELPGKLFGILPKEALIKAGHEYKDFEANMVRGQGLDVTVTKVFINRQRIRLDLTRNVTRS
ncbi:MAG: 30S ribosomal protein S1 [Crenarchaeota archaeon]|nr:30S ribosomal protein S1 [Thermoproteota archaeon]